MENMHTMRTDWWRIDAIHRFSSIDGKKMVHGGMEIIIQRRVAICVSTRREVAA